MSKQRGKYRLKRIGYWIRWTDTGFVLGKRAYELALKKPVKPQSK
jgi:hypothetical protein